MNDIYENEELMAAFLPMWPMLWDEADESGYAESVREDCAYYGFWWGEP